MRNNNNDDKIQGKKNLKKFKKTTIFFSFCKVPKPTETGEAQKKYAFSETLQR